MNANADYELYDGLGLAGLVKDGSVSAAELLEAAIDYRGVRGIGSGAGSMPWKSSDL